MGSDPRAHLAYGFDLGTAEEWYLAETTGEYGELVLPWYDETRDDDEHDEERDPFAVALMNQLYHLIPDPPAADGDYERESAAERHWEVELDYPGAEGSTGYVLIATGSERSVEWADTMALDPGEMLVEPAAKGWDVKVAAAITALGITPVRPDSDADGPRHQRPKVPIGPRWLVYPSYG